MAPDRMQIQSMCKKDNESFKEYAQRWRDLAAQVAPPMMEREMITMIVDILLVFYYEKMVAYMPSNFEDLVFAGKRIEVGLRRGKFEYTATVSSGNRRPRMSGGNKKEGETHVVTLVPTCTNFPLAPLNPMYQYRPQQYQYKKERETHVVTVVPTWPNFPLAPLNPMYQYRPQQYQYSANVSPSHYSPPYQPRTPNHPQRPPLDQPQNPPDAHPRPNTIPNTNQNTN